MSQQRLIKAFDDKNGDPVYLMYEKWSHTSAHEKIAEITELKKWTGNNKWKSQHSKSTKQIPTNLRDAGLWWMMRRESGVDYERWGCEIWVSFSDPKSPLYPIPALDINFNFLCEIWKKLKPDQKRSVISALLDSNTEDAATTLNIPTCFWRSYNEQFNGLCDKNEWVDDYILE